MKGLIINYRDKEQFLNIDKGVLSVIISLVRDKSDMYITGTDRCTW